MVTKLSNKGDLEWERVYGGSGADVPDDVEQTDDGGYVVAGYSSSPSTGLSGEDLWVWKLNSAGDIAGCTAGAVSSTVSDAAVVGVASSAIIGSVVPLVEDTSVLPFDPAGVLTVPCGSPDPL